MLKLKHKHTIDFPHIIERLTASGQMVLSPVTDDSDELTQAIANDVADQDDQWELVEHPNPDELVAFWTKVEGEVTSDPEWSFVNDEE